MNYLRGAVNAISVPYQYYKDINPATLTGAIDVIVISRPTVTQEDATSNTSNGVVAASNVEQRELACSPFHVRFGKWQVLRPADKKVNVFVNGDLIPFSMKIGDAGEAFFVFETDEDIPDDMATSPLLEATKPGEGNTKPEHTGRFAAKEGFVSPFVSEADVSQEPDFLDLNATSKEEQPEQVGMPPMQEPAEQDTQQSQSLISRTAALGKAALGVLHETEESEKDKLKDQSVKDALKAVEEEQREYLRDGLDATKHRTSCGPSLGSDKGDEILPQIDRSQAKPPEVTYGHDMVFDTEGYHSHSHVKQRSDVTITNGKSSSPSSSSSTDVTPGPSRSTSPDISSVPFPRATSEPPPDLSQAQPSSSQYNLHLRASTRHGPSNSSGSLKLALPDTEAYSWEWGSFPQKTPVWTAFNKAHHFEKYGKGKERMSPADDLESRTDYWTQSSSDERSSYGSGGLLTVDRKDPARFRVFIEGRTVEFELSLVSQLGRFEKLRTKARPGSLGGKDEVEDALLFDSGRIDLAKFLHDERVVGADNLVIRWAGDIYITREDQSPLMDALVLWREAALAKGPQASSRPFSPVSDAGRQLRERTDDTEDAFSSGDESRKLYRSVTTDAVQPQAKPASSSWVRWWSRRRDPDTGAMRPELRPASSEPPPPDMRLRRDDIVKTPPLVTRPLARSGAVGSAPALLRTPESVTPNEPPSAPLSSAPEQESKPRKKFAKTLRLTSDQLKSLNLRPGPNSITFSLSSSGVAACTARIFVWDYADQIVVSDIDGTITKSDALGHVFTMIGRDWTHLGVAKLYTDIRRNGYKIMYLTSRAIGQADSTRDYLKGIKQNDYQLPEGPVVMSPDRLMASLHREVIMRKPEVFKMACLRDIQRLFGLSAHHPFYAGFGNRITDALSYRSVNVPSSRIFTIDSSGEVKMELLELAGYKSSYIHMTDLVDQMFPPINRKWAPEYTDFNYWKTPIPDIPLPDLTPPSPALSARSDTSNQSTLARLRNFSLVSRQASSPSRFSLPPPATDSSITLPKDGKDTHLRQMSSLERLSSTLASLRQSASNISSPGTMTPTSEDSESEDEGDENDLERGKPQRRRRRSISSMPGSLPGSTSSDEEPHFGEEEGHEDDEGYGYEGEDEEEVAAEAFDEDLLATGEMESVPFL